VPIADIIAAVRRPNSSRAVAIFSIGGGSRPSSLRAKLSQGKHFPFPVAKKKQVPKKMCHTKHFILEGIIEWYRAIANLAAAARFQRRRGR
jgi:hypothetical protein